MKRQVFKFIANDDELLDFMVRFAAVLFLVVDILDFRTFIRDLRVFLPCPLWSPAFSVPQDLDWPFLDVHIAGLVALIWKPRYRPAAAIVVGLTALRILGDVASAQPFTLMYAFTILMAMLSQLSSQSRLQALRLMIVGVYFWAGFNKLNNGFFYDVFPWFIRPFWTYPPGWRITNTAITITSFLVPVFESLIGLFLVLKNTRALGTIMAAIMLCVVLACLGPLGHGVAAIIVAWNIYLFISEAALFLAPHDACVKAMTTNIATSSAAALFILAPALGLLGLWDAGPSFKLYAGNAPEAYITLDPRENTQQLPEEVTLAIQFYQRQHPGEASANSMNVLEWLGISHLGPYPSERVYRTGAPGLCHWLQHPETATLYIFRPGQFDSLRTRKTVEPLCQTATQPLAVS
ncbi:MAG: hypothetical protein M3N08_08135 [Pseudomonadota bacterium]|nr:hypothetical protein [Pseudomonadota bacterium]